MRRWHLPTLPPSSEKEHEREPGPAAPRVSTDGPSMPRVLFSEPECRAVVVDLPAGEEMGEHVVHERALVHVVSGQIAFTAGDETVECDAGTLVNLEPGERHSLQALLDSQLLLILAPWPAKQRAAGTDVQDPHHLPRNAVAPPEEETPV